MTNFPRAKFIILLLFGLIAVIVGASTLSTQFTGNTLNLMIFSSLVLVGGIAWKIKNLL